MDHEDVLEFWFGADDAIWWKKDPAFDDTVRARFGERIDAACAGRLDHWLDDARSALALVILLDQFTRNTRRGSGSTWDHDARAQAVAQRALAASFDQQVSERERAFFYMPLMHAEHLALQARCVALFEAMAAEASEARREAAKSTLKYAVAHRDIVARFGRFPHRNALLGRESTPEELAFLQQPGSAF